MASRSVIVLDLDLTLLCTSDQEGTLEFIPKGQARSRREDFMPLVPRSHLYAFHMCDGSAQVDSTMWGCFRPGYREFICWAREVFDYVVVWSAGRRSYVHELVAKIWNGLPLPDLVLTFNDLETGEGGIYKKPLEKVCKLLGVDLSRVILIDDNPYVSVDNPNHALLVPEYDPMAKDECLYELMDLLDGVDIGRAANYGELGLRHLMIDEAQTSAGIHHQIMVPASS